MVIDVRVVLVDLLSMLLLFFFSSRRRHTRCLSDWSSDVCSSDLKKLAQLMLDREDDILTHSATEIAEMAGVSKATAARFFQHLGYADFNEVKQDRKSVV